MMTSLFPDTDAKTESLFLLLMREAPAWRKLAMVDQLNQTVQSLAHTGLRKRHPQASPEELKWLLAELTLGHHLVQQILAFWPKRNSTMIPEPVEITPEVAEALDDLEVGPLCRRLCGQRHAWRRADHRKYPQRGTSQA